MIGAPVVGMLLDNHYGPDPRVELEATLLHERGFAVRIVAWDRRNGEARASSRTPAGFGEVIRIPVPAPSGGGRHTLAAMLRFARRVWAERTSLFAEAQMIVVHDVYLLPLGAAVAWSRHVPFVYDAHEEYAAMEAARYPPWWLRFVTGVETAIARRAHAVVVPGESRVQRWTSRGFAEPIILRNLRDAAPEEDDADVAPSWDIVYCGTLADVRRLDLLLDLARRRSDLRVAIAGRGRGADAVERSTASLPNVDYLGWRENADSVIRRSRAVYYGLDPAHPYSRKACPNTLYDALRHRRPLVFFCGGEPELLAERYRFGVRCAADVEALAAAVDSVLAGDDWDFDGAVASLAPERGRVAFVETVTSAAGGMP